MGLFYGDIIKFVNKIVEKSKEWPSTEEEWESRHIIEEEDCLTEEDNIIYPELDKMLCELGRHDYESVFNFKQVDEFVFEYDLCCAICNARKTVQLHTDKKTIDKNAVLKMMR